MTVQLFTNARIFTPVDSGRPARGARQGEIVCYTDGAMEVTDGVITAIGNGVTAVASHSGRAYAEQTDCQGCCMIPGFVDPHTHMCFASRRESEFEMRLGGAAYLDILKAGGGILSSMRAMAQVSESELLEATLTQVQRALDHGTTTVEIKSGYGLDTANELKMLRVIKTVDHKTPLDVVATFLGAHAVPPAYADNPDGYVALVIEEMLPAVEEQGIATFCDVFCEAGVFNVAQSERILKAAQSRGLQVKMHADEVEDLGGAALAAALGAVSADHLLAASEENLVALSQSETVATLLPATAYSLRKSYAPARFMIDHNLPVAVATDCNPGSSYTESMPFVIGLAVLNMMMSPAEALTAATLNAAYAIGMQARVGSLEPGKQADFVLIDGKSPAMLAYHAGVAPIEAVFKRGVQVAGRRFA